MPGIEKRRDYRPRRQRESQAYRLVLTSSGTGLAGIVTLVLAFAGVVSVIWPIILILISVFCVWRFMKVTGQR